MKKKQDLTVPENQADPKYGINRREMVRRLMLAGGAGLGLPGVAEGYAATKNLTRQDTTTEAGTATAEAEWSPTFLDQHQSETLTVLGERIIPGSSKAQVNQFIDLLLSVDTQDAQKEFLASLSAIEAESLRRFSHPYKDLAETQQNEILNSASKEKQRGNAENKTMQITMRDHFGNIKNWIASAYYSSEIGMKELGWTGQVFFTSFPGCQESRDHHS